MDIIRATKEFESWVSGHIPVVRSQLFDKHKKMVQDPVQFSAGYLLSMDSVVSRGVPGSG